MELNSEGKGEKLKGELHLQVLRATLGSRAQVRSLRHACPLPGVLECEQLLKENEIDVWYLAEFDRVKEETVENEFYNLTLYKEPEPGLEEVLEEKIFEDKSKTKDVKGVFAALRTTAYAEVLKKKTQMNIAGEDWEMEYHRLGRDPTGAGRRQDWFCSPGHCRVRCGRRRRPEHRQVDCCFVFRGRPQGLS